MKEKIRQLTRAAQQRMQGSTDPIHDFDHVSRVVGYVERITSQHNLTSEQREAVLLAAWWHDVARTLTKNPSFVLMPFFDDMISSVMLWWATIRQGLFGNVVGLSTKIVLCKSLGTGAIFTRLLLSKKDRILVDIVKDADKLDILSTERTKHIHAFVEESTAYRVSYRLIIWWWYQTNQFSLKTEAAMELLSQLLQEFITWLQEPDIMAWHTEHLGAPWTQKNIKLLELYYQKLFHQSSV